MSLQPYFQDISQELFRKAKRMARDFASHRPTSGSNKEQLVRKFLRGHLPGKFGVESGLVLSGDGGFSNQADLIVVDKHWNFALHPSSRNKIWLVESVFAMIEVKSSLTPSEIEDAVKKCRRFKQLARRFDELPNPPRSPESLFVLWGFEGPSGDTLKKNLVTAFDSVPRAEQPDFVLIPDRFFARSGVFHEMHEVGSPGSETRRRAIESGWNESSLRWSLVAYETEHALLAWLMQFSSWLKAAALRSANLNEYLTIADMNLNWLP